MRRVVVTGLGIVSSIGIGKQAVVDALRAGRSGICFVPEYASLGLRSHVHGAIDLDISAHIPRKILRFMGDAASFAYVAALEAIADAGLTEDQLRHERTGIVAGSGGGSTSKPNRPTPCWSWSAAPCRGRFS